MADIENGLKSLLVRGKRRMKKLVLKLNIQKQTNKQTNKTKIIAPSLITSW